ncbi:tyrosine-type recombinase/integrase [Chloroflexota bacterium]
MKTYLNSEEVEKLELAACSQRDRLLIRLLSRLGCRVSEALAISVDDIDFGEHMVIIQHLKTRLRLDCPACGSRLSGSHRFCPRCGLKVEAAVTQSREHRRIRSLPIDDGTLSMLNDFIKQGKPLLRNGKRFLFGISRHQAWRIVKDCAQRAGLKELVNPETGRKMGISPHRLRDAFAIHAVKTDDSGDGLRLLQEHLGHASFNTTARYRKVAGDEHREWYEKLWSKSSGIKDKEVKNGVEQGELNKAG